MPVAEPVHDRVHEPREDPRWRESYYFSFFDAAAGIGGFTSIGSRPSKGRTGSINCLWGPAMPTLVASEYDRLDGHADRKVVGGLTYEPVEALGPWRLRFEGHLNDGGDGVECDASALTTVERSTARPVPVRYELTFEPRFTPYLYRDREEWRDLFDGHVDEVGDVHGYVEIDGERHAIDGRGAKDHSWGVRDWFKPDAWRWLDVLLDREPELALWRARFGDEWVEDGALFAGSQAVPLDTYVEWVSTVERPRKPRPAGIRVRAAAGAHSLSLTGEVVRVVPIFFGRDRDGTRETSWNDRALVRCTTGDGATGWANVEFETRIDEAG